MEAFRLLDLPRELRDHIYKFALAAGSDAPEIISPSEAAVNLPDPALTAACRLIRHECLDILHDARDSFWQIRALEFAIDRTTESLELPNRTMFLNLCKPLAHQPIRRINFTFPKVPLVGPTNKFTVNITIDKQGKWNVYAPHSSDSNDEWAAKTWTSYLQGEAVSKGLSYVSARYSDGLDIRSLCLAISDRFAPIKSVQ